MWTENYDQIIYGFRNMVHDRWKCYFSFLTIFFPLTSLGAPKINKLKKIKKKLEIWFYTYVPKIMARWFTVSEIWCVADGIVISHFGLFFALLPLYELKQSNFPKNEKNTWRYHHFTFADQNLSSDSLRLLRYGAWEMEMLLLISGYFCPFTPLAAPKKFFCKNEKQTGGVIILHICTKKYGHIIYHSRNVVRDRWNCYFSF